MSHPVAASRSAIPAPMPIRRPTPVTSATGLVSSLIPSSLRSLPHHTKGFVITGCGPEAVVAALAPMTMITAGLRTTFREQGFVVVPGVLSGEQVETGRQIVATSLAEHPTAPDHVGFYFLWPRLATGDPLLKLYQDSRVSELAAELIRPDLGLDQPDFAQVALTIPPWPHRPGGPHVDGLNPPAPDGTPY